MTKDDWTISIKCHNCGWYLQTDIRELLNEFARHLAETHSESLAEYKQKMRKKIT